MLKLKRHLIPTEIAAADTKEKIQFDCDVCLKKFTTERDLMNHCRSKHSMQISCCMCPNTFNCYKLYRRHLVEAHKFKSKGRGPGKDAGPPAKCDLCSSTFPSTTRMLNHKSLVHCVPITCNICGKNFKSTYLLKYHLRRHEARAESRKWNCTVCACFFPTRRSLHEHFSQHHGSRHGCERCGLVYNSMQALRDHLRDECQHAMQCDTCGHKTLHKQSMIIHQITHFKIEDLHVCKVCSRKFLTRRSLQKHSLLHQSEEELKFTCEVCGKRYDKYGSFQKHRMRFHPEVLNRAVFRCPLCNYVTKSQETLKRHKDAHSVARHVCEVCGKALSCSTALRIHRNIHTGEKPYSCEICGKAFTSPNYLRKHHRVHYPTLRFIRCRGCSHNFSDNSYKDHTKHCPGRGNSTFLYDGKSNTK